MRILYILLIVICFYSCNNEKSLLSEYVEISDCLKFSDEEFTYVNLKSHILNDYVVDSFTGISKIDTVLFALTSGSSSDTLIHCFSSLNNIYVGSALNVGNGPNEFLSASTLEASVDSSCFWVFDIRKQIWSSMSLENLNKEIKYGKNINFRKTGMAGFTNPIWIDNDKYIVSNLFKHKERFFFFDKNDSIVKSVCNSKFFYKENLLNDGVLADIYSTRMCVTPNRSNIILAGRYMDVIEIYDNEGSLLMNLKGPESGFHFHFDEERSLQSSSLVKSLDSRRAYLAVKATNETIYALYSGKEKRNEEHYSYSKCLYSFSINGKALKKYILDVPILDFVVDEERKIIYAISINREIVYFLF